MSNKERIKVFFLVNANFKIGGGHLVRCKLIADELNKHQVESCFIFTSTDENFKNQIQKSYNIIEINENDSYNPSLLVKIISEKGEKACLLVIDSDNPNYYKANFQVEIRASGIKLMIITINPNFKYNTDIILNQNIIALTQEYKTASYTKKLLGPQYFILDKKYRAKRKKTKIQNPPFNLLIAFGGADYNNLTRKILGALCSINHYFIKLIVVVGGLNKNKENIVKQIEGIDDIKIELHVDSKNMDELMQDSDLAITSSGLTFWELATMEIPSFIIAASEREKAITNYLHNKKYCFKLGEFDNLKSNNVANEIRQVIDKGVHQLIQVKKLAKQINLNGVELVVKEMLSIF